jgi:hypothetical protein
MRHLREAFLARAATSDHDPVLPARAPYRAIVMIASK